MSSEVKQERQIEFGLREIELLNFNMLTPVNLPLTTNFQFKISVEIGAKADLQIFIVKVIVQIRNEDQTVLLGEISVACNYFIKDFSEVVIVDADNHAEVPKELLQTLNSISLSTTRGIMFGVFRGTFLHSAILPIMDPKMLVPE